MRRMDIVVDFEAEQFIIELKLWKGEAAQEGAYEQLAGYMKTKNAKRGYLLTFDFRKGKREAPTAGRTVVGECEIFEVTVQYAGSLVKATISKMKCEIESSAKRGGKARQKDLIATGRGKYKNR